MLFSTTITKKTDVDVVTDAFAFSLKHGNPANEVATAAKRLETYWHLRLVKKYALENGLTPAFAYQAGKTLPKSLDDMLNSPRFSKFTY